MLRNLNNILKFANHHAFILILISTIWITAQCSKVVAQNNEGNQVDNDIIIQDLSATAVICPCGPYDPTCCKVGDNSCCAKCNCNGNYVTGIGCTACRNLTRCTSHKQCASNCCDQSGLCNIPAVCYYPSPPVPKPSERPSCKSNDDCLYGHYGDYCCEDKCFFCCTDEHCKNNPNGNHFCVDKDAGDEKFKMCVECRTKDDCPSGKICYENFCVMKPNE